MMTFYRNRRGLRLKNKDKLGSNPSAKQREAVDEGKGLRALTINNNNADKR